MRVRLRVWPLVLVLTVLVSFVDPNKGFTASSVSAASLSAIQRAPAAPHDRRAAAPRLSQRSAATSGSTAPRTTPSATAAPAGTTAATTGPTGTPAPSAPATTARAGAAGTAATTGSATPMPLPQAHHHPHPLLSSNACAIGETLTVPFTLGATGVSTVQSYLGPVTITVSGVGQANGSSYSDAFYIYTDGAGNPIDPIHFPAPDFFYDWSLWINGGPADDDVQPIPTYDPGHIYTFAITAPGGPLTFAVGDTGTGDNTGAYTVTVTRPTGTIPWHPHHTVRFSDHLNASVDLADGHVDVNASSLSIPGRGSALTVNHVWASALSQDALTTTAGQGWVSSLTPRMSGVLTQTVFFNDQTGATWPFSYTGDMTATSRTPAIRPRLACPGSSSPPAPAIRSQISSAARS